MVRFQVFNPFDRARTVSVTLEGSYQGSEVKALQEGISRAAIETISPAYFPWLKSKGGECPAQKPNLVQHIWGVKGECEKCGKKQGASASVPTPAPAPVEAEPEFEVSVEPEAEVEAKAKKKAK